VTRWLTGLFGAVGVALAGCGGGGHQEHRTKQASGGGPTLACGQYINEEPPPSNYQIILGVVALPATRPGSNALQTARSGLPNPANRLFAKAGLLIRAGSTSRLVVRPGAGDRPSIGWGSPAPMSHELVIDRCRAGGGSGWLSYPGGFWVARPSCVSLLVESGGRQRQMRIGVGGPCPGQKPPLAPTQN
jgi:hypothetical protein